MAWSCSRRPKQPGPSARRTRQRLTTLICALALTAPTSALAASARTINIAPGPIGEALISLALQADLTLANPDICHGRTPGVRRAGSWREALQLLLRDADCSFEIVDARTVRLKPAPTRAARPPAPPAPRPLVAELVVTSPPSDAGLIGLPAGASSVRGARFQALGMTDIGDLNILVAGLMSTNLGPGRNKLMLRGLSDGAFTGENRSAVGIYLDDVPLTYDSPDPDLRFVDVERLDVARGPQGSIFGAAEPGGVVRAVANKPRVDAFGAQASLLWATTHRGGQSYSVDAMLNAPIIRDRLAVRLVGYDEARGGFIRDATRRGSLIDRTTRRGGRLAALLQLNDDWRLSLSGATQQLTTGDTHYVLPQLGRRPQKRVRESHHDALHEMSLDLHGEGAWGRLSAGAAFVDHTYASVYDASTSLQLTPPIGLAAYFEPTQTHRALAQLRYSSPEARRLRWLVGLYLSQTDKNSTPALRQFSQPIPIFQERRHDESLDRALYGEMTYDVTQDWSATLGGRLYETSAEALSIAAIGRHNLSRHLKLSSRGFSPLISIQRRLPGGGSAYLLYSESYRPGGLNSPGLGRGGAPRTFTADRLQNYELGARLNALDGRASLRATLFYERWVDLQAEQYTSMGGAFTANLGAAANTGLAMEAQYALDDSLTVAAQAQLTGARLAHVPTLAISKVATGLPGVAPFSGGGLVEYRRPVTHDLSLVLRAEAAYVGRSHLTLDARSPSMGGYVSDRLAAELRTPRWSAGVFVENIGDTVGNTFSFGNPFSLGREPQETPQRPRTIGVRFTAAS